MQPESMMRPPQGYSVPLEGIRAQMYWEMDGVQEGIKRFGQPEITLWSASVQGLMRKMMHPLIKIMQQRIEGSHRSKIGRKSVWHGMLNWVGAEELAFLTVRGALSLLLKQQSLKEAVPYREIVLTISELVMHQSMLNRLEKVLKKRACLSAEARNRLLANMTRSRAFEKLIDDDQPVPIRKSWWLDWSLEARLNLGGALLKPLLDLVPDYFEQSKPKEAGRRDKCLTLSEAGWQAISREQERLGLFWPAHRPMLIAPKPWIRSRSVIGRRGRG
ncbi:MAG: hypothetical protein HQL54_04435 [Magnetococcales bacterium]|nr:hypothetical protein [Magnetococcales bacterium]